MSLGQAEGPIESRAYEAAEKVQAAMRLVEIADKASYVAHQAVSDACEEVRLCTDSGYDFVVTPKDSSKVEAFNDMSHGWGKYRTPEELRIRRLFDIGHRTLSFIDPEFLKISVHSYDVAIDPVIRSGSIDKAMADNADKASQAPPKQAETDKPLQPTVEDLKLAAISTEEITDYAILHMFNNTIINSKEDMKEFFAILDKYRPELSQRIAKLFSRKIS